MTKQITEKSAEKKLSVEDAPLHTEREKTYKHVEQFLEALKKEQGHAWPLDNERLLLYIGEHAWIECAQYEQPMLTEQGALEYRPKIFN